MKEISELMRGVRDVPFGHQWTARTPIVFPWRNMVVWGLGLPIGLAAWVGWGWMGVRLLHRRRIAYALPWLWGTMFFLYQATQWVKSMRYLLPVYPVFVLFAAWMAIKVSSRARSSKQDDEGESSAEMPPDLTLSPRSRRSDLVFRISLALSHPPHTDRGVAMDL